MNIHYEVTNVFSYYFRKFGITDTAMLDVPHNMDSIKKSLSNILRMGFTDDEIKRLYASYLKKLHEPGHKYRR